MNKVIISTFCFFLFNLLLSNNSIFAKSISITWSKDFNETIQLVKHQHKYVLVDVYAPTWLQCKKLDRFVYNNPSFIKFIKNKFKCVKVNADDNSYGQKFAHKYGASDTPTILVFNSQGKLIGKIHGYLNASQYIEKLEAFLKK